MRVLARGLMHGACLPVDCNGCTKSQDRLASLSPAPPPPWQATVLLLEMLDVDKALAALAAHQPIDEAVRRALPPPAHRGPP